MTEIDRKNIQGFVVRGYRLPFAAYGGMTVEQVQDNLGRRRALLELVIDGQGTPPADLKARFMETFPLR